MFDIINNATNTTEPEDGMDKTKKSNNLQAKNSRLSKDSGN